MVTEFEEDNTPGWFEVDLSKLDPDRENGDVVPFKVVANRFTAAHWIPRSSSTIRSRPCRTPR